MSLFQELNAQGITIVLVTHEPEVAQYAHRIVEVRDGRIRRDVAVPAPRRAADDLAEYDRRVRKERRMKPQVLLKLAARSVGRNGMRTALTTLGILIGVGSVIIMVAVGQGARLQVRSQIGSLGSNLIVITPGTAQAGGVSQGAGTFNRLSVEDVQAIDRGGTMLAAVSPVVMTRAPR